MKEAPLYNDAIQLARWISDLAPVEHPAGRRAVETALDLLEHVAVALHGIDPDLALEEADRAAVRLRALLRLSRELELISDGALLHGAGLLDRIGRQIGGWQRRRRGDS